MISTQSDSLWRLVKGRPQVDPNDLAEAIRLQVGKEPLDYRTRLLIRDSVEALRSYWGTGRVGAWLATCPEQERIETICREEFERPGFPSLKERLMEKTALDRSLVSVTWHALGLLSNGCAQWHP